MTIVENFGYRQIALLWRLSGLLHWLIGAKSKWGTMPVQPVGNNASHDFPITIFSPC